MKHFIVEITYTASLDVIKVNMADHRVYLQKGYELGLLLMSGPQNPWVGGVVVARATSSEELVAFFKNDPYQQRGLAKYRFIEFGPVMQQDWLKKWVNGE